MPEDEGMRRLEKLAVGIFVFGITVIVSGLGLEAFEVMRSAWPAILLGFGCIAASVLLDGYKGSPLN